MKRPLDELFEGHALVEPKIVEIDSEQRLPARRTESGPRGIEKKISGLLECKAEVEQHCANLGRWKFLRRASDSSPRKGVSSSCGILSSGPTKHHIHGDCAGRSRVTSILLDDCYHF